MPTAACRPLRLAAAALLLLAACCSAGAQLGDDLPSVAGPPKGDAAVFAAIAAGQPQDVIVLIKTADAAGVQAAGVGDLDALQAQRSAAYAATKSAVFGAGGGVGIAAAGGSADASAGAAIAEDYPNLPIVLARVGSAQALEALRNDPRVASVEANKAFTRKTAETLPFIRQPQLQDEAADATGAGCTIVVIGG